MKRHYFNRNKTVLFLISSVCLMLLRNTANTWPFISSSVKITEDWSRYKQEGMAEIEICVPLCVWLHTLSLCSSVWVSMEVADLLTPRQRAAAQFIAGLWKHMFDLRIEGQTGGASANSVKVWKKSACRSVGWGKCFFIRVCVRVFAAGCNRWMLMEVHRSEWRELGDWGWD